MRKFDTHMHYHCGTDVVRSTYGFKRTFALTETERACLLSIPTYENGDILQNLKGLYYKDNLGDKVYAYAGLYYENFNDKSDQKAFSENFYNQVKAYMENGFDGVKFLEGKPSERKKIKVMLSSEVFDKTFSYLEEQGVPVNIHNSDPITFWDESAMPEYQRKQGWFVGKDFPSKDELFYDIIAIVKKHPKLKLTLAHLGFTSDNIEHAKEFLSFENTMLDFCPGGEQFVNMSNNATVWKQFIIDNITRFKFGTDCPNLPFDEQYGDEFVVSKYATVTKFFETSDTYTNRQGEVTGINLDKDLIDKIYYQNAFSELGEPKKINYEWVKKEIAFVEKHDLSDSQKYDLQKIKEHFA